MKFALLVTLLVVLFVAVAHVRFNLTPSMPVGMYWATSPWQRGDTVAVCAPPAIVDEGLAKGYIPRFPLGPCWRHTMPLVKVLAAIGGDAVGVSPRRISVNGATWPYSQRRYETISGEPITQWMNGYSRLAADRILVLGENPESWDSRVWGPIPSSSVRARWIPILTTPLLTTKES
ncbi:MAG: S26 family signal peptidase [Candidatus Velthaea sp.]